MKSKVARAFRFFLARPAGLRQCPAPNPMIIHKLIYGFLKAQGGSPEFYRLQARDAIEWMQRQGVKFGPTTTVLEIGRAHV